MWPFLSAFHWLHLNWLVIRGARQYWSAPWVILMLFLTIRVLKELSYTKWFLSDAPTAINVSPPRRTWANIGPCTPAGWTTNARNVGNDSGFGRPWRSTRSSARWNRSRSRWRTWTWVRWSAWTTRRRTSKRISWSRWRDPRSMFLILQTNFCEKIF